MSQGTKGPLFAIYKNGNHLGNERAVTSRQAIINYVIASQLEEFVDDDEFMSKYSAVPAIEGVHYTLSRYLKNHQ